MNTPSPSAKTSRLHRLLVTLVIASAAAAVTAGVALNGRHHAEGVVERAEARPALAAGANRAPVITRQAPLLESAPSSASEVADRAEAVSDPSLPAASEALKGAPAMSGEPAPTF